MKTNPHLYKSSEVLSLVVDRIFDGKHLESTHATVLSDTSRRRKEFPFKADVIGKTIYNTTDLSSGIITAQTAQTVTAILTGGTSEWDKGDDYVIGANALVIQEQTQLRQIGYEQKTVTTPGTAVNPTSNKGARAVRIINNNTDGRILYVGLSDASVDGSATPAKGVPLYEGDSKIEYVDADASEVFIDANIASSVFDVQVLGV